MKKIFYLMLTLVVVLATSCSNEEIEIRKEAPVQTLNYSVSTQPAYDKIGVTDSYKSRFLGGDNSYELGIYTFFYDENGCLVVSDSTYTKTFSQISQSYNLKEGNYTAITIEMLVDADNNYTSDYWIIAGKEQLSSLEIIRINDCVYYGGVVAVSTEMISIDGNKSVAVTPSPLGAIIDVGFYNFDQSEFNYVAFFTKDEPVGRYLSPLLNGTERYHYENYLAARTWTSRGYNYEKNGLNSENGVTIYIIEEGIIQYGLAPSTVTDNTIDNFWLYPNNGDAYLTLNDGSRYYGGLWYTGNGGCNDCEGFVGTKTEYETWLSNTDRTVNKRDFTYNEPYVQWGESVASVQSYMSKYTMTVGNNGSAVAQSDGSYGLEYSGLDNETAIQYYFTSATTGLFESDLFFDKTKYSMDDIISSMQGNTLLQEQDGAYLYMSPDQNSYIMVFELGDYNVIGYVDAGYLAGFTTMTKTSKTLDIIKRMRYIHK